LPQQTIRLRLPNALPAVRSRRTKRIAEWFGLRAKRAGETPPSGNPHELDRLIPRPGQILLITGPSGAGKSSLLTTIKAGVGVETAWIDLNRLALRNRPLVDCFAGMELEDVLGLLNRVGLGEAWTYLRTPKELSDGQRWRFRLALGMRIRGGAALCPGLSHRILVCDEFAALLDRVTAAVVAHALRRVITTQSQLSAIVVTSHDDLTEALAPDLHVYCDFGIATLTSATSTAAR
jgi:ABC-type ATPase with predicted acetyltransferase domain